ncbi:hypothetical protein HGRIS_012236 [Hohenbuehelia grisea]|uniref:Secreted protein n=1 Tax=Hohenbuehelia grisea TaxID=104357 RepID=A0ABR3IRP6_9AGAR
MASVYLAATSMLSGASVTFLTINGANAPISSSPAAVPGIKSHLPAEQPTNSKSVKSSVFSTASSLAASTPR